MWMESEKEREREIGNKEALQSEASFEERRGRDERRETGFIFSGV